MGIRVCKWVCDHSDESYHDLLSNSFRWYYIFCRSFVSDFWDRKRHAKKSDKSGETVYWNWISSTSCPGLCYYGNPAEIQANYYAYNICCMLHKVILTFFQFCGWNRKHSNACTSVFGRGSYSVCWVKKNFLYSHRLLFCIQFAIISRVNDYQICERKKWRKKGSSDKLT